MTTEIAIVLAIVLGAIALFIWNRLPVIVVAMGSALALYAAGILDLTEALAGFGDPVILFIAALFIVTAGLEATGVTAWAGRVFERAVAGSRTRLQVVAMLAVAILCPLINASGAVGALLPVVMLLVVRLEDSPARVLMPLAFASGAGSHLALTGAPKNVLIADAVADSGAGSLNFFEFALVGLPLLAGTIVIVVLLGDRLLPKRAAQNLPPDLSRYAHTVIDQYNLAKDVFRLRIGAESPLIGLYPSTLDLTRHPNLRLVTVTDRSGVPRLGGALRARDELILRGTAEDTAAFAAEAGLSVRAVSGEAAASKLINRMSGVAEVVIPPRSRFLGRTVFPGQITSDGELAVLAIQRHGQDLEGEVTLTAGDHILIQGPWETLERRQRTSGVLVVDKPDMVKKQTVVLGLGARSMLAIVTVMIVLIAGGFTPPAVAALFAAGATLVIGVVTPEQAYRAVNWTTVILMAGMFPLSTALYQTGGAQYIADSLVVVIGDGSPRLMMAGVFLLGVGLGIVISNTATCLILIPIAVLLAEAFAVSPLPVLMVLSVATSASFLTPVSTPVNTMVMGPAGYAFADYWRLGLPLTLWYFVVALWLVPVIWPL
jgi:di/tricarboxylate transporter